MSCVTPGPASFNVLLVFDGREIRLDLRDQWMRLRSAAEARGLRLAGHERKGRRDGRSINNPERGKGKGTAISIVLPVANAAELEEP